MVYLIVETHLGDIKPRSMFDYYLVKNAGYKEKWVANIDSMFIGETKNEAEKFALDNVVSGRTWEVVEKSDDFIAKKFLSKGGYGV